MYQCFPQISLEAVAAQVLQFFKQILFMIIQEAKLSMPNKCLQPVFRSVAIVSSITEKHRVVYGYE